MEKFFHLKENGTTVSTEIMAGLTTFFAMSYIIIVNPQILSSTGMPWGGVFLATIIAAIIGTLVMGLFANVPYAQAAGMGLNAFFTYTVCFGLGFKWQETLCMVFLCGLINIIITVTKIRKMIIQAIPRSAAERHRRRHRPVRGLRRLPQRRFLHLHHQVRGQERRHRAGHPGPCRHEQSDHLAVHHRPGAGHRAHRAQGAAAAC